MLFLTLNFMRELKVYLHFSIFELGNMRQQLLELFQIALDAVHGQCCVSDYLQKHDNLQSEYVVVAIGKAAQAMAIGCEEVLSDKLVKGLLITKYQHTTPGQLSSKWQIIESAHPVPDEQSLKAGQVLLDFINHPEYDQQPILFLISGGASALVEVLAEGHDYTVLQQVNSWLLASGLEIEQVNQVRKKISQIKGGKLLSHLQDRDVLTLMISDVQGDHPHVIGSGLLFPQNELEDDLLLPDWLEAIASSREEKYDVKVDNVPHQIVASNQGAKQAIQQAMSESVQDVFLHDEFLLGDAADKGRELANYLIKEAQVGVHIWGGETTVKLPEMPGRGGRNQHLALAAAVALEGMHNIVLLAAGTDGSDGSTEDAGAIIDGGTVSRGQLSGLDPASCLARADSGSFLEAAGDLLCTGPTGTNVMDLVIAIKSG